MFIILSIIKIILMIVPLLIAVAYLTLFERKLMASIQKRRGPNVIGYFGLLQPLADGLKLLLKETITPSVSNKVIFFFAPIITFELSLITWAVIPFDYSYVLADINIGILYILAVSSLGVYGIIFAGWSSNSKYAFLGSLRSAAQMISYEVSIGLIILCVVLCSGSLNLTKIVLLQENLWNIIPLFPLFLIYFISGLAETNRPPFDLPEAEAELVSGYNVEYSSLSFALFFLGEYANMILMCSTINILFLGGWLCPFITLPGVLVFSFKTCLLLAIFIWIRVSFPRYRYDQLMQLGWKVFLPISIGYLIFIASILLSFDLLIIDSSFI